MSVRAGEVLVSASDGMNIQELKEKIASLKPEDTHKYPLIQDLIDPLDLVILVVPIDKAAPKGRLILPQRRQSAIFWNVVLSLLLYEIQN